MTKIFLSSEKSGSDVRETRIQWFRRMASRLQTILQRPGHAVSEAEALALLVGMIGLKEESEIDPFPATSAPLPVDDHAFNRLSGLVRERYGVAIAPADLTFLLLTPGDPVHGKIKKSGPFHVARLRQDYPLVSHLLHNAIRQLRML